MTTLFICPCDQLPLQRQDKQWRCANGHSFDIAKQGHVNLLLAQQKQSKDPGDSKAMVAARQRWLQRGWYQPIARQLQTILQHLPLTADGVMADAGCGDGYYLHAAQQAGVTPLTGYVGWDISKWAVLAAAKQYPNLQWAVASNRQPPLAPASLDVLLCAFGFADFATFAKLLKPGGYLILIDPAAQHLLQLRQVIYPEVRQREVVSIQAALEQGFTLHQSQPLCFDCAAVPQTDLADLLLMTPHLFRAPSAGKAAAAALTEIDLSVDVRFRVLQRNCG